MADDAVTTSAAAALVMRDPDYPVRTWRLDILRRVLNGSHYSTLPFRFDDERTASGEYIPLRRRAPSVRYPLARIVVEDSVALLFGTGQFPDVLCSDVQTQAALHTVLRDAKITSVMMEAARRGAIGSVAILMRVLRGRIFCEVMETLYLTPQFDPEEPDEILELRERRKVAGAELISLGYSLPQADAKYWFERKWTRDSEIWYPPYLCGTEPTGEIDAQRTVHHGFGFVPVVWVRNLPGGQWPDGEASFTASLDTGIEIDYQLSQAGRGLKYSADPTLLIKEPAGIDGTMIRGAANALVVSEHGDAKLLEISGAASQAVIDYVRTLREFALEAMHGNRSDASRLSASSSGRALALMTLGLRWLTDNLRTSYGEGALLPLCRMILRASSRYPLKIEGKALDGIDPSTSLTLRWNDLFNDNGGGVGGVPLKDQPLDTFIRTDAAHHIAARSRGITSPSAIMPALGDT